MGRSTHKLIQTLVASSLAVGMLNFVFSGSAEARFTPPPEPDYAVPAAGTVSFGDGSARQTPQSGDRRALTADNGTTTAWTNQTMAKLDPGSHRYTYYRLKETVDNYTLTNQAYKQTGSALESCLRYEPVYATTSTPVPGGTIIGYATVSVPVKIIGYTTAHGPTFSTSGHTGDADHGRDWTHYYGGDPYDTLTYVNPDGAVTTLSQQVYRNANVWYLNDPYNRMSGPVTSSTTSEPLIAHVPHLNLTKKVPIYQYQTGISPVNYQGAVPTYGWVTTGTSNGSKVVSSQWIPVGSTNVPGGTQQAIAAPSRTTVFMSGQGSGNQKVVLAGSKERSLLKMNRAIASTAKVIKPTFRTFPVQVMFQRAQEANAIAKRDLERAKASGSNQDLATARQAIQQAHQYTDRLKENRSISNDLLLQSLWQLNLDNDHLSNRFNQIKKPRHRDQD